MDRKELLKSYLNGYDLLTGLIKDSTEEMLYYKPAFNKWSVVEIIVHLADADCTGSYRLRKAIAESGCTVDVYDQDAWASKLNYQKHNVATSLALFKIQRLNNFQMLSHLDEKVWDNFIIHPERGKISLSDLLKIYTDHVTVHLEQIKRNFQSYNNGTVQ